MKPKRAYTMTLTIGGNSKEDVAHALKNICTDMLIGQMNGPNGCSGSPSVGYHYEIEECPEMTAERYFTELDAYLAKP